MCISNGAKISPRPYKVGSSGSYNLASGEVRKGLEK
nr:MAG TPA: hypothetical protein [Caudoviricetes sp.]DAH14622.1 MAG TPA: hypothetical protein [Bacteriophage sp.]DAJ79787.1 MAG TPA: hypothetical protein [Caudoviricetes sp.]DAP50552.1 MAG TPA: hypothetical protein [Caudoviricetes sp.]